VHRFLVTIGRFAARFRWAIVGAWVAATVLVDLLSLSLTGIAEQNKASSPFGADLTLGDPGSDTLASTTRR
jgi:uncharacterized membrane protein YdfJ with MMPL/SSD domain